MYISIGLVRGDRIMTYEEPMPTEIKTNRSTAIDTHYHQAKYVEGILVRECNQCGEDLMHESHLRQAAQM